MGFLGSCVVCLLLMSLGVAYGRPIEAKLTEEAGTGPSVFATNITPDPDYKPLM
jgi:hypothetical protein